MIKNIKDNEAKSCGNFQRFQPYMLYHSSRVGFQAKNIITELSKNNEYNMTIQEAMKKQKELENQAKKAYEKNTKQRFKTKQTMLELVVNLRDWHTLDDLKKVANLVQEMFGYTPILQAIHKDEGHIDKDGNLILNIHAHLDFFVLDTQTGKSLWKQHYQNKAKMKEFQSRVAEILEMERGIASEKKHQSPKEFKAQIKANDGLSPKQVKEKIKALENELKEQTKRSRELYMSLSATREDYAQLEAEKKSITDQIKNLKSEIKGGEYANFDKYYTDILTRVKELGQSDRIKQVARKELEGAKGILRIDEDKILKNYVFTYAYIEEVKTELARFYHYTNKLERDNEKLRDEISDLQSKERNLQATKDLKQAKEEINMLKNQVQNLKNTNIWLENELKLKDNVKQKEIEKIAEVAELKGFVKGYANAYSTLNQKGILSLSNDTKYYLNEMEQDANNTNLGDSEAIQKLNQYFTYNQVKFFQAYQQENPKPKSPESNFSMTF